MTEPHPHRALEPCRVVVGADAVRLVRSDDPAVPIVALVDGTSPAESILAQVAGADVVVARSGDDGGDRALELDLAVESARVIARRRMEVASSSRRVGHDLAQSLNVITLAAETAIGGGIDPSDALDQIRRLARDAGADAWRAGRAFRSSSRTLGLVDLRRVVGGVEAGPGVEVIGPDEETLVLADERGLVGAVTELVGNARRAGAGAIRVEVRRLPDGERAEVVVADDGVGFPAGQEAVLGRPFSARPGSDRPGLGLAGIAELLAELGGHLDVAEPGRTGRPTRVVLSLPTVGRRPVSTGGGPLPVDLAAAQADILEGVVRHAPLAESLEAIVAAIEQHVPGTVCSVLLLGRDGRSLHHGAGARLPATYRQAIDGVAVGPGQGACGTAAFTGRPVVSTDITVDRNWTDFRDVAVDHGLRSCWSTPIVAAEGGDTLGTFAVYKTRVWEPDQAAMRLVDRFSYLAAVAIEHHRLFEALAESEARFRGAFEGTAAGIALVDLDGTVLKVNPALSELVGRPVSGLVGSRLLDLFDERARALVTASWSRLVDADADVGPPLRSVDVPLAANGGEPPVWLSLHTSLIAAEAGGAPYLYVEVRDITAARAQLADLRAREAAEAANRAKTDFLALASHELRTPLNAILGFAQVMQLVELDDAERVASVDQIVDAGRHLRDLIDALLDLSRIEAGHLAVETEPVATRGVILEALGLVRPLASARHIEVVDHTEGSPDRVVVADRRCLRQVLINLLDNAVKYTPERGRVDVAVSDTPDGSVRIGITDTGPGISADSLDVVFEPFHRLDAAADDHRGGTGLGLALCARLMAEMGGSIGVASTLGAGSCFWIDFPPAGRDAGAGTSAGSGCVDPVAPGSAGDGGGAQAVDAIDQELDVDRFGDEPIESPVLHGAQDLR